MKTKFEYEKVKFDRLSRNKTTGRISMIDTDGFLVKDLGIDYIQLVVHRTPYTKDKWIVSEFSSGHRLEGVESDKTKNHAVVDALKILQKLGQHKVEEFVEECKDWADYYRSRRS